MVPDLLTALFPQPGRLAVTSRLGRWLATTRQNTLFRLLFPPIGMLPLRES